MGAQRVILHVDMDAFFASVEQRERPELRGRPVVIGAARDARGVVAAASYEARRFGVHSAMPSRTAARLCPEAVFLPPDMELYAAVSRQVFAVFERFTPWVEPLSIDEAFLDVTGARALFGSGPEVAEKVRAAVRAEVRLTASVGVAPNKFLAKLASDMNKPDGITVVPTAPEAIRAFLAPLPVGRLWGVGKVAGERLRRAGIMTIGDIQSAAPEELVARVGAAAADHLRRLAWGVDDRAVESAAAAKSISREYTFPDDTRDAAQVTRVLLDLADEVGGELRADGRAAGLARLKVRWKNFETLTRQMPLNPPARDDFTLREAARRLLAGVPLRAPVRLIGFGVSHFRSAAVGGQLELFDARPPARDRKERLSATVDRLRRQFGPAAVRRAASPPP